jgi:hypothetical protein
MMGKITAKEHIGRVKWHLGVSISLREKAIDSVTKLEAQLKELEGKVHLIHDDGYCEGCKDTPCDYDG